MSDKNTALEAIKKLSIEELDEIETKVSAVARAIEFLILGLPRIVRLVLAIFLGTLITNSLLGIESVKRIIGEVENLSNTGNDLSFISLILLAQENIKILVILSFSIYTSFHIIGFLVSVISRIYAKARRKFDTQLDYFLDSCIDFIEELLRSIWWQVLGRPIRQYYEFIANENRYFEPPGCTNTSIPYSLDDTCVPLDVRVTIENKNGIRSSSKIPIDLNDKTEIWHFLALGKNNHQFRRMVLLGKPGSGKSTLLKSIVVAYAQKEYKKVSSVGRRVPNLIPVLLPIREISDDILIFKKKIENIIVETLEGLEISKSERFIGWIRQSLRNGECLVMVDGLDEVADNRSRTMINCWVNNLIKKYPKSFFLITSRYLGHDENALRNVVILEVRDLDLLSAEQFIFNWYRNRELIAYRVNALKDKNPSDANNNYLWKRFSIFNNRKDPYYAAAEKRASGLAGTLISRIRSSSALAKMAINPLSLSMMVIVHSNGNQLPELRAELYRVICNSLLSSRRDADLFNQSEKSEELGLNKAQKMAVLQSLSLSLMKNSRIEFSSLEISDVINQRIWELTGCSEVKAEAFLEYIKKSSGLLVDTSVGKKQFSHRCIQEYLAASQIRELREENFLISRVNEHWWNETIRIYASTSIIESAARIVETAVQRFTKNPEKNVIAFKLAYDCLEECPKLPENWKAKLYGLLDKNLESENSSISKYSAEVKLLQRFSKNFMGFDQNLEFDCEYLTQSEYQLFVDGMQPLNKYYQPDNWYGSRFKKATALECVILLRPSDADAFCDWLSKSHVEKGFKFRLPNPDEERETCAQNLVRQRSHGLWCKSKDGYELVGASSKHIDLVRKEVYKEIRSDFNNAQMLQDKFRRIHSIACKLRKVISNQISDSKDSLSQCLESLLNMNTTLRGYRGILIDDRLISILIEGIRQTLDIRNSTIAFRRDGDVKASKNAKECLECLKKFLRMNKALFLREEIKRVDFLTERLLIKKGRRGYRKQELADVNEIFECLSKALVNYLDGVSLELSIQIAAIERALNQVDFYSGAHDLDVLVEAFADLWQVLEPDSSEQKELLYYLPDGHDRLSLLKKSSIVYPYVLTLQKFLDRSSEKRKEVDLTEILPFLSLSFAFWSTAQDLLKAAMRRNRSVKKSQYVKYLSALEKKKQRIIEGYIITIHVWLGLQHKLPLFGGIRLVREKTLLPVKQPF